MSKIPSSAPSHFDLPNALDRHLSDTSASSEASIARYVETGGRLVTTQAIDALFHLLPALTVKLNEIEGSTLLMRQIELLTTYFRESYPERNAPSRSLQDTAFALLYFVKGFDRIPDSVPEVGLLDDAMVVLTVLQHHRPTLREHWLRRGRSWPNDF